MCIVTRLHTQAQTHTHIRTYTKGSPEEKQTHHLQLALTNTIWHEGFDGHKTINYEHIYSQQKPGVAFAFICLGRTRLLGR